MGAGIWPARSEREREIFEEAKFGIRYGFTFPIHDHNGSLSGAELCDRRPSGQL
ncbi:autoinducer binding domain-containing protein [Bradyrhizobium sp. CW1]|uniref:autoinducer binding domain-containing protein n=1 Tax=Bradyrhizobium sp. CW1 TaxID=2782686 RepID=UPI003209BA08